MTVVPFPHLPRDDAKVYWHCAGDLFFNAGGRGVHLPTERARQLRDLYATAAGEAYENRSIQEARRAARLWRELTDSLDALDHHCRVTGRREAG